MVNLKNDPNKKHYFAEVNPQEYPEIMNKILEDKVEILAWEQGKSDKDVEKYTAKSYDKDSFTVSLKSTGGLLSKLSTSKLIDKDIFIKIGSGKFQFFSTTVFKQNSESKNYELVLNRSVFKTLQRENYRLQTGPHIKIQFRIDDDTLHNALDISAGGTAFIVPEEEATRYEKGTIFKDCKLGLNKDKFNIPTAKVAGSWPVKDTENKPTGELKVGLAFEDITDETEEAMFKSINGEARAEEMRKKLLEKKVNNK
jgi:TATA-box binding protein (TBP) (component of TFIID and TFIIIB)